MKTVYLIRRERFNAAHKLWNEEWSEEKNKEVFGICSNPNWHGHNFEVFVTVKGIVNEETGFFINSKDLSKIIKEYIVEPLDHKNLNLDVPFLHGTMATTENIAMKIWEQLEEPLQKAGAILARIQVKETENNFVEYFGGNEPF